jgi:hypothetical protein
VRDDEAEWDTHGEEAAMPFPETSPRKK